MGVIVDGIIGPILESLGIVQIGEDGEWVKQERKPRTKKESHWLKDIGAWFSGIIRRVRKFWEEKFLTRAERGNKKKTTVTPPAQEAPPKLNVDTYRWRYLKEIPKFEGKALISSGNYKVWYGNNLPDSDEIMTGVVYIVRGSGRQVSSIPYLNGIRYDAYYILDKEKYDEERKKEIDEKINKLQQDQIKKATINTIKECLEKSDHLMNEEHMKLREEARDRWSTFGINVIDPKRTFTITPDSM